MTPMPSQIVALTSHKQSYCQNYVTEWDQWKVRKNWDLICYMAPPHHIGASTPKLAAIRFNLACRMYLEIKKKKKKKKGKKEKEIAVHAALILLWGKHALYRIPEYYLFLLTWAQQAAWSCPILKIGIEVHLNKAMKYSRCLLLAHGPSLGLSSSPYRGKTLGTPALKDSSRVGNSIAESPRVDTFLQSHKNKCHHIAQPCHLRSKNKPQIWVEVRLSRHKRAEINCRVQPAEVKSSSRL